MIQRKEEVKRFTNLVATYTLMDSFRNKIVNYSPGIIEITQISIDLGQLLMCYSSGNSVLYGTFKKISSDHSDEQFIKYFSESTLSLFIRELRNMLIHIGINQLVAVSTIEIEVSNGGDIETKKSKVEIKKSFLIDYLNSSECWQKQNEKEKLKNWIEEMSENEKLDIVKLIERYTREIYDLWKIYNDNYAEIKWKEFSL